MNAKGMSTILSIDQIAKRSKDIFEENDFVEKAYVFGSFARGEQTDRSDIDFMIQLNKPVGLAFFGLYDRLETEFHRKVDVITQTEAERIMKKSIDRDKVLIYENKNQLL